MKRNNLIHIGKEMGLLYNEESNYQSDIDKGVVVFDGANGQRFRINSKWVNDVIYQNLGFALVNYGKRLKAMEINSVISINKD